MEKCCFSFQARQVGATASGVVLQTSCMAGRDPQKVLQSVHEQSRVKGSASKEELVRNGASREAKSPSTNTMRTLGPGLQCYCWSQVLLI